MVAPKEALVPSKESLSLQQCGDESVMKAFRSVIGDWYIFLKWLCKEYRLKIGFEMPDEEAGIQFWIDTYAGRPFGPGDENQFFTTHNEPDAPATYGEKNVAYSWSREEVVSNMYRFWNIKRKVWPHAILAPIPEKQARNAWGPQKCLMTKEDVTAIQAAYRNVCDQLGPHKLMGPDKVMEWLPKTFDRNNVAKVIKDLKAGVSVEEIEKKRRERLGFHPSPRRRKTGAIGPPARSPVKVKIMDCTPITTPGAVTASSYDDFCEPYLCYGDYTDKVASGWRPKLDDLKDGHKPWWKVDLGKECAVVEVKVLPADLKYEVFVGWSPSTQLGVDAKYTQSDKMTLVGEGTGVVSIKPPTTCKARFIRLEFPHWPVGSLTKITGITISQSFRLGARGRVPEVNQFLLKRKQVQTEPKHGEGDKKRDTLGAGFWTPGGINRSTFNAQVALTMGTEELHATKKTTTGTTTTTTSTTAGSIGTAGTLAKTQPSSPSTTSSFKPSARLLKTTASTARAAKLPTIRVKASSFETLCEPYLCIGKHGKDRNSGWVPVGGDGKNPWLEIDLGRSMPIASVLIREWGRHLTPASQKLKREHRIDDKDLIQLLAGRPVEDPEIILGAHIRRPPDLECKIFFADSLQHPIAHKQVYNKILEARYVRIEFHQWEFPVKITTVRIERAIPPELAQLPTEQIAADLSLMPLEALLEEHRKHPCKDKMLRTRKKAEHEVTKITQQLSKTYGRTKEERAEARQRYIDDLGKNFKSHKYRNYFNLYRWGVYKRAKAMFEQGFLAKAKLRLQEEFNLRQIMDHYRCEFPGCKKPLEALDDRITCQCTNNFCKSHRDPIVHECPNIGGKGLVKARALKASRGAASSMTASHGLSVMQEVIEEKCTMDEKFDNRETVGLLLQVLSLAEAIEGVYKQKEKEKAQLQALAKKVTTGGPIRLLNRPFRSRLCPTAVRNLTRSKSVDITIGPKSSQSALHQQSKCECGDAHSAQELRFFGGEAGKERRKAWVEASMDKKHGAYEVLGASLAEKRPFRNTGTEIAKWCPGCGDTFTEEMQKSKGGDGTFKGQCAFCAHRKLGALLDKRVGGSSKKRSRSLAARKRETTSDQVKGKHMPSESEFQKARNVCGRVRRELYRTNRDHEVDLDYAQTLLNQAKKILADKTEAQRGLLYGERVLLGTQQSADQETISTGERGRQTTSNKARTNQQKKQDKSDTLGKETGAIIGPRTDALGRIGWQVAHEIGDLQDVIDEKKPKTYVVNEDLKREVFLHTVQKHRVHTSSSITSPRTGSMKRSFSMDMLEGNLKLSDYRPLGSKKRQLCLEMLNGSCEDHLCPFAHHPCEL